MCRRDVHSRISANPFISWPRGRRRPWSWCCELTKNLICGRKKLGIFGVLIPTYSLQRVPSPPIKHLNSYGFYTSLLKLQLLLWLKSHEKRSMFVDMAVDCGLCFLCRLLLVTKWASSLEVDEELRQREAKIETFGCNNWARSTLVNLNHESWTR